eukprot:TRINITY_DN39201_c0_g1_i1.p1 TRINITY_DN39201_c0_g1~~TRINITY_DN39201_c0_g1_i1.p1  ORF type:complete len:412 (+),score=74.89 TRINITY_DN39201_c0_g1_i1:166-1236(+)
MTPSYDDVMDGLDNASAPKPEMSMPEDLPDDLASEIVTNMKSFVKGVGGKRAVLLTFGDSTMGGVEMRLYQALHTEGGDFGLYSFGQCPGWGAACRNFKEAPAFNSNLKQYQDVYDNIKEAMSILETNNCTFGGHTFLVRSYMQGSLIHYSWGFGAESFGACWKPCLTNAIKALQPSAIMVNQGLHLLHAYPYRSCSNAPSGPVSYFDCGKHGDLVSNIMSNMQTASPITLWKTSNWVCDDKYFGFWRTAIDDWHDPKKKIMLEKKCQAECPSFGKDRPCGDEVIDARSSELQREQALASVASLRSRRGSMVGTVDAYKVSENRCDATEDGRHYRDLDPEIVRLMAAELARMAAKL